MEPQKQVNDEIDLGSVFKKLGDAFLGAWLQLMRFLAAIRSAPFENRISFIGIIAVSVLLSVAYSLFLKRNYYESTMILSSQYLNKRLVDNALRKLDQLAGEQKKDGLAKLFNIPDSTARNIIGFKAAPFVSESDLIELELLKEQLRNALENEKNEDVIAQVIQRIEVENRHSFEITIRTLNPTIIPNLQSSLVGFFRDNEYVKRRIEITKINLEQKKLKLAAELQKIDSLKSIIYANYKNMAQQSRSGSNNVILSDGAITNPIEVFNQDRSTYEEMQRVNRALYLQADFEVIDGFTEFREPASPSTTKLVLYAILIGIVVAYLEVAVRSFNSYLSKVK